MPGLKKIISSLRLRPAHHENSHEALPAAKGLKRTNAKLYKRNRSSVAVEGVLEHSNEGEDQIAIGWPPQRQPSGLECQPTQSSLTSQADSFQLGRPLDFFEVELQRSTALRSERENDLTLDTRLSYPTPDTSSPVSKYGLRVNTANLTARTQSPLASPNNSTLSPDRYGLRPRCHCLSTAFSTPEFDAQQRPRSAPAGSEAGTTAIRSQAKCRNCPKRRELQACPVEGTGKTISPPTDDLRSSQSRTAKPAIRDLDWSKISAEQLKDIVDAYNNPSPADSAVGLPEEQSYSGKGKARLVEDGELYAAGYRTLAGDDDWEASGERQLREVDDHIRQQMECTWRMEAEGLQQERERMQLQLQRNERVRLTAMQQQRCKDDEERTYAILAEEERRKALHEQEALRKMQEESEALLAAERDRLRALEIQREEDERLAAEAARLRDCAVCGDEKDILEFPAKSATAACEHTPQTCKECLESWMASEFETKGTEGIKCPECTETLDYSDVQQAASAMTFAAYDKIATRNALASLEEFAWCLAPNCTSGQLNIDNNNFMDCTECGFKQCLKHKCAWHTGETCRQYEYRSSGAKARDEERASELEMQKISKQCPGKNCGWRIEKTTGCKSRDYNTSVVETRTNLILGDHMTCRKCRHEFCWQCLAAQKEIKRVGNTAHERTCKFHSDNLNVAWPFNVH